MRVRRRTAVIGLALVAALSGCGDSSDDGSGTAPKDNRVAGKPADQILADSAAALEQVRSVRMQGTVAIDGKPTAVKVDIEEPAKVRFALRLKDASATLIVIDDSAYIKGNAAYWRQQEAGPGADALADEWIKAPGSGAEVRDITKGLDLATLSRCLRNYHGTLSVAGKARVGGRPSVVIEDEGDRAGSAPGKLFVSTTGEPLPLRVITTGKERPGGKQDSECNDPDSPARAGDEITFTRYNEDLNIEAPAGANDFTPGRSKS